MRASDRRARVSSIPDVSPAQLQTDDKSLRQAFATLLRNSSAHWPAFVSPASARASFPVPSMVSGDRKSTRLNSSHQIISYAVFCLKKKNNELYRLCILSQDSVLYTSQLH